MSYTRNQLINAVLDELEVSSSGGAASGEDYQKVSNRLSAIFADLSGREVYYVEDETAIDDDAFESLVLVVANKVKRSFGLSQERSLELKSDADKAEKSLEIIARDSPTNDVLTCDAALRSVYSW